jgi:aminoglycoside 6-adenylyltransferase
MLDVDFAIFPVEKMKQFQQGRLSPQMEMQIANVVGRGMRILLDKDGTLAEFRRVIPSMGKSHPKPPTPSEFLGVTNDFLYHTVWTAKHLLRGELWWADTCINCRLSQLMLRMMEWHAQALHEWKYDTWFRGRFLEHWTDQRTLTELKATFTHHDEEDTKRSLIASLSMFRRIATETSQKLGYEYPEQADRTITEWLQDYL